MEIKLNEAADEIAANARNKGFHCGWDNVGEKLMLVVTELSEAMEVYRKMPNRAMISAETFQNHEEFVNFREELADAMIRILDMTSSFGIDIESEIIEKHTYNLTRPYRHGKAL